MIGSLNDGEDDAENGEAREGRANPLPNIGTLLVVIEAEELRLAVELALQTMSMIESLDDGEDDAGNEGGAGMVEPKDVPYFTALEYLKVGKDCFRFADKSFVGTIMAELSTMKYDGSRGVQEHILNMYDKAAMLATLGIQMDESFLIQAILNSLPAQFGPFKIHCNAHKKEWSLNELTNLCVHEEVRLRKEKRHTALTVTQVALKKKGSDQLMSMMQEMGIWTLLEGCLLLANALAILNEERFLVPRRWSFQEFSGVRRNSMKGQLIGLIYAVQYMRILLVVANVVVIVVKLVSG
ncbi:hypothetical protein RHSIM_Rhsim03G0139100 [Rhododendron simsii]|uniref:Uncharacterized protein n=1 Tax=Rhododendron simsii TaxID=118357 RepID=A0A834H6P3_RHOSS|nr:hypothetical protein RHSIM_Rhsim03G0139100 [Rhododendron simsii]